ncbi:MULTISPECIES: hypothetical protein [Mycobacterium]|uniref:Membrane protein ArfC n=1 Tax=Mycobacterium colombiense TaxID=339268 RepID=A0A329LYA2_9MYCO|nr:MULTISPECIES: hypothetical protein [Mycobacterium]MDM4143055.1 hypothetical protein [Mycobacterium sp. FLAC0960]RAV12220.1 hypothetical protein DQP57_09815 [Mycobacterium colombiense]
MSQVNWWLFGLSFALGLLLTLTLIMIPAKSPAPVDDSRDERAAREPDTTHIPVTEKRTTTIPVTERRTTKIPVARESPTTKIAVSPGAPYGPGSADAGPGGGGPAGFLIKAQMAGKLYLTPDDPSYDSTTAQVWFRDEKSAQQAGFTPRRDGSDKPVER